MNIEKPLQRVFLSSMVCLLKNSKKISAIELFFPFCQRLHFGSDFVLFVRFEKKLNEYRGSPSYQIFEIELELYRRMRE